MKSTRAKALISAAAVTAAMGVPAVLATPASATSVPSCKPSTSWSQPISFEAKVKVTKNTCNAEVRAIAYCHMAIVTTFTNPVLEQWWWQDGNAVSGTGTSDVSCGSIWTNIADLHVQYKTSSGWVTYKYIF